jgi:hypothetical protein
MAQKPKQKLKAKLTDKEQSERFKKTARELGAEESENFEQIFKKIALQKSSSRKLDST